METEAQQIQMILWNLLRDVPTESKPLPIQIETAVAAIMLLNKGLPPAIRCDFA